MKRFVIEKNDVDGNVDGILLEIGRFGSYQKVTCLLLFIIMVISVQSAINYMVTTNTLEYRWDKLKFQQKIKKIHLFVFGFQLQSAWMWIWFK